MDKTIDVLVVGGGPVGMFASFMCSMVGLTVHLVDALGRLGGQCSELYPEKPIFDIPGFPRIKAKDLIANLKEQMSRFEIGVSLDSHVTDIIQTERGFMVTLNGEEVVAKSIILATGEGAFKPNRPNLENLSYFEHKGYVRYSMNDLNLFRDKVVTIGGGGDSAVDWCLTLSGIASHVYLIHRRPELRAMPSLQDELARLPHKVTMIMSASIVDLKEVGEQVKLRYNKDGEHSINTDYFIPCYGVQGDKSFLAQLNVDLDHNDKVKVDPSSGESSVPGIYAIGDASTYTNKRELIVCGFGEAANAAYHIRMRDKGDFVFEYSTSRFT